MSFKPQITQAFWSVIEQGDLAQALLMCRDIDQPAKAFMASFPGGRDAVIHGIFELFGVTQRWRREPCHSLTDDQWNA